MGDSWEKVVLKQKKSRYSNPLWIYRFGFRRYIHRRDIDALFRKENILAGVPLPAFLLTHRVRSSTISTSKYPHF